MRDSVPATEPAKAKPRKLGDYELSPAEEAVVERWMQHRRSRPPAPKVKRGETADGDPKMHPNHPSVMLWQYLLSNALGTIDHDFASMLCNQLVMVTWITDTQGAEATTNGMLAAMQGIAPREEIEAMLATQMVATHQASMECFRRVMLKDQSFEGREFNLNQANKLCRTHAALLETLNKHRGKGQQKVTVEHVHVERGGQAIVGSVEHGGRGSE